MENVIYGLSTNGLLQAITDHSEVIKLNCSIENDNPVVIVDDAKARVPEDSLAINTSNFAKLIIMDEESREEFFTCFEISKKKAKSVCYCMVGNDTHSQLCEIGYSMRMMNGNVGAELFVAHACGFILDDDRLTEQIKKILEYVSSRYTGELCLTLDGNGKVCNVLFGHAPHFLAVYAEFLSGNIDGVLEYILGKLPEMPQVKRGTSLMAGVSQHVFPFSEGNRGHIRAEIEAEKHLWRTPLGLIFVTAWSDKEPDKDGTNFSQCRKRIFRTIRRMRKYDDFLQYRTDIGYGLDFKIAEEDYQVLQKQRV